MADTPPAGATPVVPGATPGQTDPGPTPGQPPATGAPTDPAAGDPSALGDAGKRALDAMKAERDAEREAARTARKALDDLTAKTATDAEKAILAARKEGADSVKGLVRRSEVRRALQAAGCVDVDVAAMASEFGGLTVDDDGQIAGLAEKVGEFKKAHGSLFAAAPAPGGAPARPGAFDATTGAGGGAPAAGRVYTRGELRDTKFYEANKADITAAIREGRVRN